MHIYLKDELNILQIRSWDSTYRFVSALNNSTISQNDKFSSKGGRGGQHLRRGKGKIQSLMVMDYLTYDFQQPSNRRNHKGHTKIILETKQSVDSSVSVQLSLMKLRGFIYSEG